MSKTDRSGTGEQTSRWEYPDITSEEHLQTERRNAVNKPMRWQFEPPEEEPEEDEEEGQPNALTAEMLEKIQHEAQQEGFAQGHDEGLKAGHEEGYQAGYEEGLLKGKEAGESEARIAGEQAAEELSLRWQQLFEHMRHPALQINEAVERQLVAMTASLAQAVCLHEINTNPDIICKVVQKAVAELGEEGKKLVLSLHPEDLDLIKQRWTEEERAEAGWKLSADDSLTRGGCVVITPVTRVDATLESRIADVFKYYIQGMQAPTNESMRSEPQQDAVEMTRRHQAQKAEQQAKQEAAEQQNQSGQDESNKQDNADGSAD